MMSLTGISLMAVVVVASGYLAPDSSPQHYWKWHKPYSWDGRHQPKYLQLSEAVHHKHQPLLPPSPPLPPYPKHGLSEKPFKTDNPCELRKSVFTQDPTASPQVHFIRILLFLLGPLAPGRDVLTHPIPQLFPSAALGFQCVSIFRDCTALFTTSFLTSNGVLTSLSFRVLFDCVQPTITSRSIRSNPIRPVSRRVPAARRFPHFPFAGFRLFRSEYFSS